MTHLKSSPRAGHTGRLKSAHIITPNAKMLATWGVAGAAKARKAGTSSGNVLKDAWDGVRSLLGSALGLSGTPKEGGGFTGWISNALSSGEGMMGLGSLLNVAGTFVATLFDDTAEKQYELDARKLDIYEELGREGHRINEMIAKDRIRQTAAGNTYMGWGLKGLDVSGVYESTPGVVVRPAQSEVIQQTGGIIGGNNQGMITQAKQGQV
jgi:hypothetical protein